MQEKEHYIRDIAKIRSIMEQSTRFMSLSGWAGILAGIYALLGVWAARTWLHFDPASIGYNRPVEPEFSPTSLIALALGVLTLAIGTAVGLTSKKARNRGEKLWNSASKRLLVNMAVVLGSGGILMLILIDQSLYGILPSLTLIFYGLAMYLAGRDSYREIRVLGLLEISLGLLSSYFIESSLMIWAIGFGLLHIVYGIYIHYKYER